VASAVQLERDGEVRVASDLVLQMLAALVEGVATVTEALLAGDGELAHRVVAANHDIAARHHELEAIVERRLLDPAGHDADEVRFLITVLRILPELGRSGDLVEHVALRVPQGLAAGLSGRARGLLHAMGASARVMWRDAIDVFTDRDAASLDDLRELDDNLDELRVELTLELCQRAVPVAAAIELALIAHAYARLGEHAVSVGRRCAQVAWD
jgi:phosphate transport system protein